MQSHNPSMRELVRSVTMAHSKQKIGLTDNSNPVNKMDFHSLLKLSRKIWPDKLTLPEIIPAMGKIFGDICKWQRNAPKDIREHLPKELQKELGNMILSTIRWCDDLNFKVEDCINSAIKAQKDFPKN